MAVLATFLPGPSQRSHNFSTTTIKFGHHIPVCEEKPENHQPGSISTLNGNQCLPARACSFPVSAMIDSLNTLSDPAYDILRSEYQPLSAIFTPRTIAVIGATDRPNSLGRLLWQNLHQSGFAGTVLAVNPNRQRLFDQPVWASVLDLPAPVDLAIIITPALTVPDLVRDCVRAGVKGAIVLSAGFREKGPGGLALEAQIQTSLQQSSLRLIGPNCLGIMNPALGLNATLANAMAQPGHMGFISQSGAFCNAVLDWSLQENVGFSALVSIGAMVDINWGDLVYYLGDDPRTRSIVIYMESIGNARSFLSAAREVALTKPIIVIKAGRTAQTAQVAASHAGALVESDAVLDAAFRRCGVLRVDTITDLFDLSEVLGKQPRPPAGSRLAIITNAGGPGVMAADALVVTGGQLAVLTAATQQTLIESLPLQGGITNPLDIGGDADGHRYRQVLERVLEDPGVDGVLVVLTPQPGVDPVAIAEQVAGVARTATKPVLASWMGGREVAKGEAILNQAGIATYPHPDAAARLFNRMGRYGYNLQGLYETPALLPESELGNGDRHSINALIQSAHQQGRILLTELESKQICQAYGIPTVPSFYASTEAEAVAQAETLGYPVVLKLVSQTAPHKALLGGVRLHLQTAAAVCQAYQAITAAVPPELFDGVTVQPQVIREHGYELIIGSSLDAQFGPVICFGAGGDLVEVFADQAVALPPLNTTLARRLMEQTKIYRALLGGGGRQPVDLARLEMLLVRFSQMILEQPLIKECDLNPVLVATGDDAEPILALDAQIVLHDPQANRADLPQPAIRPYPTQYVKTWQLKDGTPVIIRPIRPEDEPLLVQFHHQLSEQSVFFRYFHLIKLSRRIAHERLTRMCFIDYDREMALVAEYQEPVTGDRTLLGVGRLSKSHGRNEGEFAMLISDRYHRQGLGTELLTQLLRVGQNEGLDKITAEILHDNQGMQGVCQKLGFELKRLPDFVKAEIRLDEIREFA